MWKVKNQTHNLSETIHQKNSIVNVNYMFSSNFPNLHQHLFPFIHISGFFISPTKRCGVFKREGYDSERKT